jgi:hypothetical protein
MNQDTIDLQAIYGQTVKVLGQGAVFAQLSQIEGDTSGGMPPWVIPPAGADPFDASNVVQIGVIGTTTTILSLLVPYGYDGVIKRFYHNYLGSGLVDGNGDVIWRMLADGRPIKNFGNILTQMGSANTPRLTDGIRIFSGQLITYVVYHANNALLTDLVTASLAGYFYPRSGS